MPGSPGQAAPGGSIRRFLIADVRGYTRFTAQHGDEAASRLAARFALLAGEGVEAWGGELVELRGDEAPAAHSTGLALAPSGRVRTRPPAVTIGGVVAQSINGAGA